MVLDQIFTLNSRVKNKANSADHNFSGKNLGEVLSHKWVSDDSESCKL